MIALLEEQAAAPGSRPDATLQILGNRPNKLVGEPVVFPEMRPFALEQAIQTRAFGANPQRSVVRRRNGQHHPALPLIRRIHRRNVSRAQSHQPAAARAGPQRAFAVLRQRTHPIVRESVLTIEMNDAAMRKIR